MSARKRDMRDTIDRHDAWKEVLLAHLMERSGESVLRVRFPVGTDGVVVMRTRSMRLSEHPDPSGSGEFVEIECELMEPAVGHTKNTVAVVGVVDAS